MEDPKMIKIDSELLKKLHTFVVNTNNYLMSISVCGDNIIKSASLMKEAMEIHKEIEDE